MRPQWSVAEEARTRGFAAPAFTGCAIVEGLATLSYSVVQGASSTSAAYPYARFLGVEILTFCARRPDAVNYSTGHLRNSSN